MSTVEASHSLSLCAVQLLTMKKLLTLVVLTTTLFFAETKAQCAMIPISLDDRIQNSELIVEASIEQQQGFSFEGNIYTTNYLKIYKVLKGEPKGEEVILISQGGQVGNNYEEVIPSLAAHIGTTGIFFLNENDFSNDPTLTNYKPYSGPQGCIYYNASENDANDVFNTYASVDELISYITEISGQQTKTVRKLNYFNKNLQYGDKSAVSINSISPQNVSAGVGAELYVRGSGFGPTIGKLEFTNASTGNKFVIATSFHIKVWTDTMILTRVPSGAGTGIVKVTQGTSVGAISGPTINYAHLNFTNISTGKVVIPYMKDDDGSGGFEWKMSPSFNNNNGAKNSFETAMTTWSDATCVNWYNGSPTSVDEDRNDGINIVRFAQTGELSNGVLGITRNRWKDCSGSVGYPNEIDLSYAPNVNWHVGQGNPAFGKYDMQSVIVHELGHAHQLGHVVNQNDLMHATIGPTQVKRDLINDNLSGGYEVMLGSIESFPCGPQPMTAGTSCNLPIGLEEKEELKAINIYPNPFRSVLNISNPANRDLNVEVFNYLGHSVGQLRVQAESNYEWDVPAPLSNGMYFLMDMESGKNLGKVLLSR